MVSVGGIIFWALALLSIFLLEEGSLGKFKSSGWKVSVISSSASSVSASCPVCSTMSVGVHSLNFEGSSSREVLSSAEGMGSDTKGCFAGSSSISSSKLTLVCVGDGCPLPVD